MEEYDKLILSYGRNMYTKYPYNFIVQNKNVEDYGQTESSVKINTYQPEFTKKLTKRHYLDNYPLKMDGGKEFGRERDSDNTDEQRYRNKQRKRINSDIEIIQQGIEELEPRQRKNPLYKKLYDNGSHIENIINKSGIFKSEYKIVFKILNMNDSVNCMFALSTIHDINISYENTNDNYSRAVYLYEDCGINVGYPIGMGRGVTSSGNRIGHFLFYLQILLVIKSGIFDFQLENFTDEPARAGRGIYCMLTPDRRTHEQELRNAEKEASSIQKNIVKGSSIISDDMGKLTLEDKLQITEGSMRFTLKKNSINIWIKYMLELIQKINVTDISPWINKENIRLFLNKIISGGKKYKGKLKNKKTYKK